MRRRKPLVPDLPAPPPAGRAFVVTMCQPPDGTDAEMTASLEQIVGRLQARPTCTARGGAGRRPSPPGRLTPRPLRPREMAAGPTP